MEMHFTFLGKKYNLLGLPDDGIAARMKYKNSYQLFELNLCVIFAWLSQNGIAIDVGAFIGDTALPMAHYFDKVYTFDPNPRVKDAILYAIANNEVGKKIKFYPYGITDKSRINSSYSISDNEMLNNKIHHYGKAKLIKQQNQKNSMKLTTLDDIIPKNEHDKIRLIKIDVEGYERMVFDGSTDIIENSKPVIVFEYEEGKGAENTNLVETLKFLSNIGYTHLIKSNPVNYFVLTTEDYLFLLRRILQEEANINRHLLINIKKLDNGFSKEELNIINSKFHLSVLDDNSFYYYVDKK